jgi:CheY-like chemotaxis protein
MQVRAGELFSSLQKIQAEGFTGITVFEAAAGEVVSADHKPPAALKFCLAFQAGALIYTGRKIPTPLEFADWMRRKMQLAHMESTLQVVTTRIKNPNSVRELVEFIARFGLIKWDELEKLMQQEVAIFLEQALSYAGSLTGNSQVSFDLSYGEDRHGLDLNSIKQIIAQRQVAWKELPLGINLQTVPMTRADGVASAPSTIVPHLQRWVTGQFKLTEIALACGEDPLMLANAYLNWSRQGWITLKNISASPAPVVTSGQLQLQDRSIILSVDDSKIVQTMIARAIGDLYEVVLASNALDAMDILHTQKVALVLLDVTMPDMDGLEMCRTIRSLSQFKNLPIIMLTAKDGMIDKVKGQFAGSTQYLTKPVDREKLLPVLAKYIPQAVKA